MADSAERTFAIDVGKIVAHHILGLVPEVAALTAKGQQAYVDLRMSFPRDRKGKLRCELRISPPKVRPTKSARLLIALDPEQIELFNGQR